MQIKDLILEKENEVATITLNRPERLNANGIEGEEARLQWPVTFELPPKRPGLGMSITNMSITKRRSQDEKNT